MVRRASLLVLAALIGCTPGPPESFDDVHNGQLQADVERVLGVGVKTDWNWNYEEDKNRCKTTEPILRVVECQSNLRLEFQDGLFTGKGHFYRGADIQPLPPVPVGTSYGEVARAVVSLMGRPNLVCHDYPLPNSPTGHVCFRDGRVSHRLIGEPVVD
jgi:hypothetical protein